MIDIIALLDKLVSAVRGWLRARGDAIPGDDRDPPVPTPHPLRTDPAAHDRVAGRRIAAFVAGMVAVVVVTGIGVGWVAPRGGVSAMSSPATEVSPADPFSLPTAHELRRAEQRASRERWVWRDRAHGRVLRPLSLAIAAYLADPTRSSAPGGSR